MKTQNIKTRFLTLDALRGLAAFVVLLLHLGGVPAQLLRGGYLAVDFFFVLSGFVLAQAYGEKDLSFLTFMRLRLIRLYPLYLVGFVLGAFSYWLWKGAVQNFPYSAILGLFVLPTFFPMPFILFEFGAVFPFNFPTWSLFFELLANALWFLLKPRLGRLGLVALCIVAAVSLIFWVHHGGSINAGPDQGNLIGGFPRVIYSFFMGIITYRFWRATSLHLNAPIWLIVIAMLAIFLAPLPRQPFDLLAVLLLFPAIVLLGAMNEPPKYLASTYSQLGTISYAVYVLHWPVYLMVFYIVEKRHFFGHLAHPSSVSTPVTFVAVVALAWLLDRYYDIPVRRWLSRSRVGVRMPESKPSQ